MSDPYTTFEVEELDDGLSMLSDDLLNRVIPLHIDMHIDFDEIRIELWGDSGRIIAFPSQRPLLNRIDKAGCQVISSSFREETEILMDSDLDDAGFTAAAVNLIADTARTAREHLIHLSPIPFSLYDSEGNELNSAEQIGGANPLRG